VAQGIVANAQAQKDPLAALRALNDGYAKAPQNVKDELLRDPGALKIIDAADAWANQPLHHADNEMMPQGQTAAALRPLDQATQGLDKTPAGLVVDRAVSPTRNSAPTTATASFDPPAGVVGASVAISVAAPAIIALVG
jgi:hypothetical protein